MTRGHSLPDEVLLDYATGAATEPMAALIAAHVALNAGSRATLRQLEALGGALLQETPPQSLAEGSLARAMAQLGAQTRDVAAPPSPHADGDMLPAALRPYAPKGMAALAWRKLGFGLSEAMLECRQDSDYKLSLLRIGPGRALPHHGHRGEEYVMVLEGGFTDDRGSYVRGDVSCNDETTEHRPVADSDGACLCLVARQGAVRFTGLLGLILNPFLR